MNAPVSELTSGASGRIIPIFRSLRSLLRVFVFVHAIVLWFLFLTRRNGRIPVSSPASPRRRVGRFPKAEEEDARRRRALAEAVAMDVQEGEDCRCETSFILGSRKNMLFCRSWVPASREMKGILVILHGLNEHSGRYARFARQLTSCNFGVYAMDWIGHGGSVGLHGYVPSLNYVVADTKIFLERIRSKNPGVPCFFFGHSTGGAVVLRATLNTQFEAILEGIILTSPALCVKPANR